MKEPISCWLHDGDGLEIPDCPRCNEALRPPNAPREAMFSGIANLPWNSGWDGCCASCGHEFRHEYVTMGRYLVSDEGYSVVGGADMESDRLIEDGPRRSIELRPANRRIRTFIDEAIVLTGVDLTLTETDFGGEPQRRSIHLTLNELREIVAALNGPLGIVQQQWGWSVDDT